MRRKRPKALISTIEPVDGGVPTMTRWVVDLLQELDIDPMFAWYEPWSKHPTLSVPIHAIINGRRPSKVSCKVYEGYQGYGIGAWLPELEFTHYLPRRPWRELISECDLHLAVTGSPLCATPFARMGIPFLAWVATPWEVDRTDRVKEFPLPRKLLDKWFNGPVLRHLEREILRSPGGRILALSRYTANGLEAIAQRPMDGIMLMPVDPLQFYPDPERTTPWKVGFSGRYGDPRKNINLLLKAVTILSGRGHPIRLELVGEQDTAKLRQRLASMGIEHLVHCHPHLPPASLAPILQTWDLFVIPSHQEGLCIAALEAMACGVPVVSTRCGGPEQYVLSDLTGQLTGSDSSELAAAILRICDNRDRRQQLSAGAFSWVCSHASPEVSRGIFRRHLLELFPLNTL